MGWLKWIGLGLQVVGVVVSTVGIWQTWRDHAPPGRKFWSWLWAAGRAVRWLWTELWKTRPPHGSVSVQGTAASASAVAGHVGLLATGEVTHPGPLGDQVRALAGRIDATNARLDQLTDRLTTEEQTRQSAVDELSARQTAYTDRAMTGGLHLEAAGVGLVVAGIALQGWELAVGG